TFFACSIIDTTGMMIGTTGTIYYRKTHAWQSMLLLMAARGGWVNTIHGNLELLDEEKARWFAKVQHLYEGLQAKGRTKTFGGIPGNVEPYGLHSGQRSTSPSSVLIFFWGCRKRGFHLPAYYIPQRKKSIQ